QPDEPFYYDTYLGQMNPTETYIVEVVVEGTGATLYVYQKNSDRAHGFSHRVDATDWGTARTYLASGSYQYYLGNRSLRVDNMSEWALADDAGGLQSIGLTAAGFTSVGWNDNYFSYESGA